MHINNKGIHNKNATIFFHFALPLNIIKKLMAIVCIMFVTGCVSTIYKAYDGLERPTAETVIVYNSPNIPSLSSIRIVSIDNQRVKATVAGFAVLPGAHCYEVWVERLSTAALFFLKDSYYTEAVCGFKLEASAGTFYQLVDVDNGVVVPANERKMYKATLKIKQTIAQDAPILLNALAECASLDLFNHSWYDIPHDLAKGGLLCRSNADCLRKGAACVIETYYSYGICSQP